MKASAYFNINGSTKTAIFFYQTYFTVWHAMDFHYQSYYYLWHKDSPHIAKHLQVLHKINHKLISICVVVLTFISFSL